MISRCHPARLRLAVQALLLLSCTFVLTSCGKQEPAAQVVTGGDIDKGMRLLAQFQCGSCHEIPGVTAARGKTGPSLDSFGRRSYIAGHIPNYPEPLVRWIVDPPAMVPQTLMPNMGVSADDARHMAAYLYTLR